MSKDYSSAMNYPLGQHLRELPGPLLITGHTGFKGTWMTFMLEHLNVPVVGYSLAAEIDSLFDRAERTGAIPETFGDIRDYEALEQFIDLHKPSTIIHMAAQPLVLKSYESPRETFDVNVMGTVNVLDIAFKKDFVKALIVVTTDKVYRNDNSGRAFVESDPLEGKDPYSASKVGTEAVVAAWQQISSVSGGPRVVSVRAGNVIGGGDFAENRIIPDLIRGVMSRTPVKIRNPSSTRPWQHVLDPCKGYLMALEDALMNNSPSHLNFGPTGMSLTVGEVSEISRQVFPSLELFLQESPPTAAKESMNLNLNSEKSIEYLKWSPSFDQMQAIESTFHWWRKVIDNEESIKELCFQDIKKVVDN
jgi:CDP-glucose 4,6-dehydratase